MVPCRMGLEPDEEGQVELDAWSAQMRREGLHTVDGEVVGRLSSAQAWKFSPIVLVSRLRGMLQR